jgi:hypothetical protein
LKIQKINFILTLLVCGHFYQKQTRPSRFESGFGSFKISLMDLLPTSSAHTIGVDAPLNIHKDQFDRLLVD